MLVVQADEKVKRAIVKVSQQRLVVLGPSAVYALEKLIEKPTAQGSWARCRYGQGARFACSNAGNDRGERRDQVERC